MFLLDVNCWLAMAFESHVHHLAAKLWFEASAEEGCLFCRMTQQGFLRLATNPKAFGEEATSPAEAWQMFDVLLGDPRIGFAEEPVDVEAIWRSYTEGQSFSRKIWNDAFLAAFAKAANYQIVTFDKGFSRYQDVKCTILS